jgi:hypothetical protein
MRDVEIIQRSDGVDSWTKEGKIDYWERVMLRREAVDESTYLAMRCARSHRIGRATIGLGEKEWGLENELRWQMSEYTQNRGGIKSGSERIKGSRGTTQETRGIVGPLHR